MPKYDMVVFDLDGVLVDTVSSWEWVHRHFGVNNDTSLAQYLGGEIDDLEFMRRDIALWKAQKPDLTIHDIERILDKAPVMPGAQETLRGLKRAGLTLAIISGGLLYMARRVAEPCRVDYVFANDIACDGEGNLTGEGIRNVRLDAKDATLKKLLRETGVSAERCAVVGDSIVDVCMFEMAGLSIAFNARDDITRSGAKVVVNEKDLRNVLEHILH